MHVTMINGSQRKRPGFTAIILGYFAEGIAAAGGSSETIDLSSLGVKPCVACEACQKTGAGHCLLHQGDGAELAFAAMRRADIVVYASPVYVFSPSSLLKSLLERFYGLGRESAFVVTRSGLLFHEVDRGVCGKPFVAIVTSDNSERETVINCERYFRSLSRFLDAPLLGLLVRQGGRLIRSGRAAVSLGEVREAFRCAGEELIRRGRVSRATERRLRRSAIPLPRALLALLKATPGGRKALLERAGEGKLGEEKGGLEA